MRMRRAVTSSTRVSVTVLVKGAPVDARAVVEIVESLPVGGETLKTLADDDVTAVTTVAAGTLTTPDWLMTSVGVVMDGKSVGFPTTQCGFTGDVTSGARGWRTDEVTVGNDVTRGVIIAVLL